MATYDYNNDIPDSGNNPSSDQPKMQENTQSIFNILNQDMIGFTVPNGGLHKKITYIQQAADPGSAAGQYVTYSKDSGSGVSELYLQKDGGSVVQLTKGTPVTAATGFTYLPGGLLLKWMTVPILTNTGTANYDTTIPFTTVYSIVIGPQQGATMWVASSTTTSVTINRTGSGASNCYVMAIGV